MSFIDITDLKQYIIDNNKIVEILESLGCHGVKENNKDFRAGLPNHSNTTSISVKKETLSTRIFTPDDKTIRGDILTLTMYIHDSKLVESNKYIHKTLGLEFKYNKKKEEEVLKIDPLNIFKKVKKRKNQFNVSDIQIHDENILSDYLPYPHIDWIREGIMPWTCKEFNIGFSPKHKRIVVPERFWSGSSNDYIGVMGRTIIKEYAMLDIPKYFPLKVFSKSMNLYGLQENYKFIQEFGVVVIFESQKSVLKRHSRNDKTSVAVGSHDLSDEQVKILIGLNIDIVIAMDKGIDINHIRSMCDKFFGIRNVYYIWDKYGLLGEKDSPADATNKIYNYLFKYKIKYDEKERREYLKCVGKQEKN